MSKKSYLTPNKVAELLMVSPTAIRLWADKGELNALTTPGGHRRFLPSEVDRFAHKKGLTLNYGEPEHPRILIVDDDAQLLRYLVAFFGGLESEIDVATANDGFEAGLKILEFKPQFVLLDLMMPHIDGIQVCRRIKNDPTTQSIRVIAMTGYASSENVEAIIDAGAEGCLHKPIDENMLLAQLGLTQNANA
ncbi:MAG: response regulator [Gammaproteobacteria bacterium]|nr:response regulator [Gammaproteobacteria bacterium]